MDLSTFYALFSGTCFTLVGLWWNVVQARGDWLADPTLRRLAGGVYLSFLLPALMGLFAQVNPDNPLIWRASFSLASVFGIVSTVRLIRLTSQPATGGLFRRNRWLVVLIYALIIIFGIEPDLARVFGLAGLQAEALLLILLVLLAHGLTWEFLTETKPAQQQG